MDIKHVAFFANAGIGNFLLYLPVVKFLKRQRPNIDIDCIVLKPALEEIARNCDFISKLTNFTKPNSRFLLKKNRTKYDAVLLSLHDSYAYPMLITFLLHPKRRIGFERIAYWKNKYHFFLTDKIVINKVMKETKIYSQLLMPLGLEMKNNSTPFYPPFSQINDKTQKWWKENIGDFLGIGLHVTPSLGQSWKVWEMNKFKRVALNLLEHFPDVKLLFFGMFKDKLKLDKMTKDFPPSRYFKIVGRELFDVVALISKCELFICNDGGLMHIADAVGTKIVAIFGPTDYRIFGPSLGEIVRLPLNCSPCYSLPGDQIHPINCPHKRCLRDVSVEMVWDKILYLLGRS